MSTVIIRTTTITKTIRHYPTPKQEWEQLEFDFVVS